MPDRTVTYNFRGNFANLAAGLGAMGKGVNDLGVKLTALDKNGAKMRAGLTSIGSTAGKVGLVAAAGFAVVVAASARFEQSMSAVQAATHETAGNMELLRDAAIEAGQATKFSATEAAGGIEELAKAGVSTSDILNGGLTGALDLAAAGGLEVADAAQIAATALTQFKLAGEDVPHVADLLAAGAGKAQGDVTDLAMALKQSGLVASQMGVSIEETTGTLSAFASAGLLGSDAGTSFRTMLLRLANPTQESAALMEQLGIQAYDTQGQFVGVEAIAGQLAVAFKNKSQAERDSAMATLFGSDAIRAANVLYNEGSNGIETWTNAVNDQGYAAETAAIKMDNLSGDLEQLKGSLETAFIGSGTGAQGPLRSLVQGVTDAVNAFNKLPPAAQSSATALLGITAVLGGGLWFGTKVIGGIASAKQNLADLGITADRTSGSLGRIARTAGGVVAVAGAVTLLGNALADATGAKIDASDLQRNLEALANGSNSDILNRITSDLDMLGSSVDKTVEPFYELSTAFGVFGNTARDNASANIEQVDAALAGLVESGSADQAAAAFDKIAAAISGLPEGSSFNPAFFDGFGSYSTALDNAAVAADGAAGANNGYGASARQAAAATQAETDALNAAVDAMRKKTAATLAAFDAETGYRQALKDAESQAKKSSAGIKGSSDAAIANRQALSGLAAAWNNQSNAVKNNVERFKESRQSFIQTAVAMGVPIGKAKELAKSILDIPKSKVAKVGVDGADAAIGKVQTLSAALSRIVSKTITITVNKAGNALGSMQFADGGYTGAGGKHEPAGIVHRGEVVLPQEVVKRDWSQLKARYGNLPGFASGGVVGTASYASVGAGGTPAFAQVGTAAQMAADALFNLTGMSKKELTAREKLLKQELDASKQRLDSLRQEREALAQSVKDIIAGGDLFTVNDPASALTAPDGASQDYLDLLDQHNAALASSGGAVTSNLGGMLAEGRERLRLIRKIHNMGVDGAALAELATQPIEVLRELAMSRGDARLFERQFNQLQRLGGAAGNYVGGAVYDKRIGEQLHELKGLREDFRQVSHRLSKLEDKEDAAQNANKIVGAIKGEAGNGARRQRP